MRENRPTLPELEAELALMELEEQRKRKEGYMYYLKPYLYLADCLPPTKPEQFIRKDRKIGRNEPCPCGSGLKFKKCCINKQ